MYSVKPGRGPSLMGGAAGIAVAIGGVIWTFGALSIGAPPFFALFGVVFVVFALGGACFNLFNATQPNRMSSLDITTGDEEPDPIAHAMGYGSAPEESPAASARRFEGGYCPYCGASLEQQFNYCPKCGKDI